MSPNLKIQKVKIIVIACLVASALFAKPIFAQESSGDPPTGDPRDELETMRAEWEKVRDQQIALIQEKEIQLEELKEELFKKSGAVKNAGVVQQPGLSRDGEERDTDAAIAQPGSLEKKIAILKEANRQLSDEISSLRAENLRLEAASRAAMSGNHSAVSDQLKKEREEMDAQKAVFLRERQKFFREMNRQKEKLWAAQSLSRDGAESRDGSDGAGDDAV